MNLHITDADGFEDISLHHVFMLRGRLDITDHKGRRTRRTLPHDFEMTAEGGLYVRLDSATGSRIGSASEVVLERDFSGRPTLTVDGEVLVPDDGFSLYITRLAGNKPVSTFSAAVEGAIDA